jgi:hypothetical protein
MRCTIFCNFYDNSKQQGSSTKNLFLTETEVTVVDENEVEGSDKENEQEEQTEPVNESIIKCFNYHTYRNVNLLGFLPCCLLTFVRMI